MNEYNVLHISVYFLCSCKPFCSCTQNLSSQVHCTGTGSQGLNIINLYAIYDLVNRPEQPIYVVVCVQYESKKWGKDQKLIQSSITPDPGYQMGK